MAANQPNQPYRYPTQPQGQYGQQAPAYGQPYPPQPQGAPPAYGPQQGAYYGDSYGNNGDVAEAGDLSHPAVAAFTRKVYTYFATALATAAAVAFGGTMLSQQWIAQGNTGAVNGLWIGGTIAFFISYLVVVFTRKASSPLKTGLLYVFAGSAGAMMAPLLMAYVGAGMGIAIVLAFGIATVTFFGLTVFTFTTGKDFRSLGGILTVGVLAILGVALMGWIVGFPSFLSGLLMGAGLLLFIGFTLFDASRVVRDYYQRNDAVSAAINLLYDFIMLFRYALYFVGGNRN